MVRTTAILTVGLLIGGGVVQVLHAQAKPPGYLIGEIAVTVDEAAYKDSEFMKQTMPSIQAAGAKYIAGGSIKPLRSRVRPSLTAMSFYSSTALIKRSNGTATVRQNVRRPSVARSLRASAFC